MTINTEYLQRITGPELVEALTHRRRMERSYREGGKVEQMWADHHAEVVEAIEAEIARRARGPAPVSD